MKIRLASDIQTDSIVDGPGIRTVIWTQGCSHNCLGCHNPSTHDFNGGFLKDVSELKKEIADIPLQTGVTFSGGDPIFQVEACLELAKFIKDMNLNIWCYTGYKYEDLIKKAEDNKTILHFLNYVDVLVDGKFVLKEKSYNVKFRGSTNQRLIDVKKSLKEKKVVLYEEKETTFEKFKKNTGVYI